MYTTPSARAPMTLMTSMSSPVPAPSQNFGAASIGTVPVYAADVSYSNVSPYLGLPFSGGMWPRTSSTAATLPLSYPSVYAPFSTQMGSNSMISSYSPYSHSLSARSPTATTRTPPNTMTSSTSCPTTSISSAVSVGPVHRPRVVRLPQPILCSFTSPGSRASKISHSIDFSPINDWLYSADPSRRDDAIYLMFMLGIRMDALLAHLGLCIADVYRIVNAIHESARERRDHTATGNARADIPPIVQIQAMLALLKAHRPSHIKGRPHLFAPEEEFMIWFLYKRFPRMTYAQLREAITDAFMLDRTVCLSTLHSIVQRLDLTLLKKNDPAPVIMPVSPIDEIISPKNVNDINNPAIDWDAVGKEMATVLRVAPSRKQQIL